jgi:tRNA modification GTPase
VPTGPLVLYMLLNMVTLRIAFHTSLLKSVKNSRSMATSMKVREVIGDTIFALSSSGSYSTKTGVAVVRISGPHAYYCLSELLKKDPSSIVSLPSARQASLRRLFCPGSGDLLDQALVLCFPSPRSFTGEDVVELHTHGSRAVIQSLFTAFEDINKQLSRTEVNRVGVVRPADRGEFTRRAFENGKMDLTEVEGLSDLLDAETSAQRKQALRQMEGYLRIKFEAWREELKGCLAYTEAVIDFGDDDREDDINDSTMYALLPRVQELRDELEYYLKDGRKGEIVREGVRIALVGKPNAGKSSLLNCLAKRPAAIVSPVAGTTRDVVEVRMDLEGVSCIVSDTAGLRLGLDTTTDEIEIEGMRRARLA